MTMQDKRDEIMKSQDVKKALSEIEQRIAIKKKQNFDINSILNKIENEIKEMQCNIEEK